MRRPRRPLRPADRLRHRRSILGLEQVEDRLLLATFTVNQLLDTLPNTPSVGITNGEPNRSFRQAIEAANSTPGVDTINFDLRGNIGAGTILPAAFALPSITEQATIDATNTLAPAGMRPAIVINGSVTLPVGTDGLTINANNCRVIGLTVRFFSGSGIRLTSNNNTIGGTGTGERNIISGNGQNGILITTGATGNLLQNNFIGTNDTGAFAVGNGLSGVQINGPGNIIGGSAIEARNVISGNQGNGILISSVNNNQILGNYIGTNALGDSGVGNTLSGVAIAGASNTTVGGTGAARNVISSNQRNGVEVTGINTNNSLIAGNYIGTNAAGNSALGNGISGNGSVGFGVLISGATADTFNGTTVDTNFIAGNLNHGILISGSGAARNLVAGNSIGISADGIARGNALDGVVISGAPGNTIGGTATGNGNVISGNVANGIEIIGAGATGNLIAGNFIGTNAVSAANVGNGNDGVVIAGAPGNTIGGTTPGVRNVISGNLRNGVEVTGSAANNNRIAGNYIGTNTSGTNPLPNGPPSPSQTAGFGVFLDGTAGGMASGNTIGGTTTDARNVISGNRNHGVLIAGPGASGNRVAGNYIGTTQAGTAPLANSPNGVVISNAPNNTIGGTTDVERNVISGNTQFGIVVQDLSATGNLIAGNYIGTDFSGAAGAAGAGALGNGMDGVFITGAPGNTVGGTVIGARNVISGNAQNGVRIMLPAATNNVVAGNFVGINAAGAALGNTLDGVVIAGAPGNTIGGTTPGVRNVISGNSGHGVNIGGVGATSNLIAGNFIGINAAGAAVRNAGDGVILTGVSGNTIGGTTGGARNVISGNRGNGVEITGTGVTGNVILGNYIGTNTLGGAAGPGNGMSGDTSTGYGVFVNGTAGNTIGGTASGAGNVISGNFNHGVFISGSGAQRNLLQGNFIGTTPQGNAPVPNVRDGVAISGAANNTIGGSNVGIVLSRNFISGNTGNGVELLNGASSNVVQGNYIGLNSDGTGPLGNAIGVLITDAPGNTVGGVANFISGNLSHGVEVTGANATNAMGNRILGNFIGVTAPSTGTLPNRLGNQGDGILIAGTANITIGGTAAGEGNVISANVQNGVELTGTGTTSVLIAGNFIGTDLTRNSNLSNTSHGILISGGAHDNSVGVAAADSTSNTNPNTIAFNGGDGVSIIDQGSTRNSILSNSIFSNAGLGIDLGNDGVTDNDPNSTGNDPGPNSRQNFPVLTGVSTLGTVSGTLTSTPNRSFLIEFFADNLPGDQSNHGEGRVFLGRKVVTTTPGGTVSFTADLSAAQTGGQAISATATRVTLSSGGAPNAFFETSEFALNRTPQNPYTVTNTSDDPNLIGSLRNVIMTANANMGRETIDFRIVDANGNLVTDPAGLTIRPGTPLPMITGPVIINGQTQSGVALDGANAGSTADGLVITAGGSTVQGLIFTRFGGAGIVLMTGDGNTILGNSIGTNASGASGLGNAVAGVRIDGSSRNSILNNIIAFNGTPGVGGSGVAVLSGVGNLIRSNSIYSNNGLGIDLGNNGVTPNDADDSDGGPNNLQNVPVLIGAASSPGGGMFQTTVRGTLQSAVGHTFQLEFFVTPISPLPLESDLPGFGQGRASLGFTSVTINDPSGVAAFNAIFQTMGSLENQVLTVTATDVTSIVNTTIPQNDTSEFSPAFIIRNALVVTTTADDAFNPGAGSLRAAILFANMNKDPALPPQTISFQLPGTGQQIIRLVAPLPMITDPVIINGFTQPRLDSNPTVTLDGSFLAGQSDHGLVITADGGGSTVRGLILYRFGGSGIVLLGGQNNLIEGNIIGTDTSGEGALSNGGDGITIIDSSNNTIGGTTAGTRNVISGNSENGIEISVSAVPGAAASGNLIEGNFIGINTKNSTLPNSRDGILISGASRTTIGGTIDGARNIISGNGSDGVELLDRAAGTLIVGNFIGTDVLGQADRGNSRDGVRINQSTGNTIGGTTSAARNIISGNDAQGVDVVGVGTNTTGNAIIGNYIGTNSVGGAVLPNGPSGNATTAGYGVLISGAAGNAIGGTAPGAGNLISGNVNHGVLISAGATQNLIAGNSIGTNAAGTDALPNGVSGVVIFGASNNTIGGTGAGARNVISGNTRHGVEVTNSSTGNSIVGNSIGTNATGNTLLGNGRSGNSGDGYGVILQNTSGNIVGGTVTGAGNVISGNFNHGVLIDGADATTNLVAGNSIGVDVSGLVTIDPGPDQLIGTSDDRPLGNRGSGVVIVGASGNTIGGTTSEARNIISGNRDHGVLVVGPGGGNNLIAGNFVGTNAAGTVALPNGFGGGPAVGHGVLISDMAGNTVGGTTAGARNVISGNLNDGLLISGAGAMHNLIAGNYIGTNAAGTAALPNSGDGVAIAAAPNNTIGGTVPGASNVISGNQENGVEVSDTGASGILIAGNFIGIDAAGTAALGNGTSPDNTDGYGVLISNTPNHTIGGTTQAARNVISGNTNHGIRITGAGATGILVQGNYIGTDANGTLDRGNQGDGLHVEGVPGITIGGTVAEAGNVISGNAQNGITASGTTGLVIQNNLVGTDATGTIRTSNDGDGVTISNPPGNTVGGDVIIGNVISGNAGHGLVATNSPGVQVVGNSIGTDRFIVAGGSVTGGTLALGNDGDGVTISNQPGNTVGGKVLVADNIISSSGARIIVPARGLVVSGSPGLTVRGNRIGTDGSGTRDRGNTGNGVQIDASPGATIGGTATTDPNIISSNRDGLVISNSPDVRVLGNRVGTDITGGGALGNRGVGVTIIKSSGAIIGGSADVERNVISGNRMGGIAVSDSSALVVRGNRIGTDLGGTTALGNAGVGLAIGGSANATIGGAGPGEGNVISGNTGVGSHGISASDSPGLVVQGNRIGTNRDGTQALGNGGVGLAITGPAGNTARSGDAVLDNVISGNGAGGVAVAGTPGLVVRGNRIGTDLGGTTALGNAGVGLAIGGSANATIGGAGPGEGNVISGNTGVGSHGISASGSPGLHVQGNFIGTTLNGTAPLGNGGIGLAIGDSAEAVIGGMVAGEGNVISGNVSFGLLVSVSHNTRVQGNRIGTDKDGTLALGNGSEGVHIESSVAVTVGGAVPDARNVISGNGSHAIGALNSPGLVVSGNRIGTNDAGTLALANAGDGVRIVNSRGSVIGGTTAGSRNIIAGNAVRGITVSVSDATVVQGNFIGIDALGTGELRNGTEGVRVEGSPGSVIGGPGRDARNVIARNGSHGVDISNSSNVRVQGNYIGTDATGTQPLGNLGDGVRIAGSQNNQVGGAGVDEGNVISGNRDHGVDLLDGSSGAVVQGNFIGTDATGTRALGNMLDGVRIDTGATANTIGGAQPGAGNVISGNQFNGVELNAGATGNLILGNAIGTDRAGTIRIANARNGVIFDQARDNTIGGAQPGAANVISGNGANGVMLTGNGATGNVVRGNFIGTDAGGAAPQGNAIVGVALVNARNNTLGGTQPGEGNVISGNTGAGVQLLGGGTQENVLQGNFIGTRRAGVAGLANNGGIVIESGGSRNTIGGTSPGAGNVISGNSGNGIAIADAGSNANVLLGNVIGTDASGTGRLGNAAAGVFVFRGASNTSIGGTAAGSRNIISGNGTVGVIVADVATAGTVVAGNFIGTDANGTGRLGNVFDGVDINNSPATTIGGATAAAGNVISGNGGDGVELAGVGGTVVLGNFIGLAANRVSGLGNGEDGIRVNNTSVTIGGPATGSGNVISANIGAGIEIAGTSANATVQGNRIGTSADGTGRQGNNIGVFLNDAVNNTIGGTSSGASNLISGNRSVGILILRVGTGGSGNVVQGNSIGTDAEGRRALGNGIPDVESDTSGIGVFLSNAVNNTIGGTAPGAGNVISGNNFAGISIFGQAAGGSLSNAVQGNIIGAAADGTPLQDTDRTLYDRTSRQDLGVLINASAGNVVGGPEPGARNFLADNLAGVEIAGPSADGNTVQGNDMTRNLIGVYINGAPNNSVGGTASGVANTLTGNVSIGVAILGSQAKGNLIQGNTINANGSFVRAVTDGVRIVSDPGRRVPRDVSRIGTGVYVEGAGNNTIGGTTAAAGNVISSNAQANVYFFSNSTGNQVRRNLIRGNIRGRFRSNYGVLLFNSSGNLPGIVRNGQDRNRITGNLIANFREFTGQGRATTSSSPTISPQVRTPAVPQGPGRSFPRRGTRRTR
jgi:hypothetical protein